jgi:hypothetical protein
MRATEGLWKVMCTRKTVDYFDECANGYHVMLDSEELVTVRWNQVE